MDLIRNRLRPQFRSAFFLFSGVCGFLAALFSQTEAAPPNIVVIVSDDQGSDDYGFRGHPHICTPHLDRLAGQSLTFERGWVPTSVCCPSLATIITGLYPHQTKITSNDPPTVPAAKKTDRGSSPEFTDRWNALLDDLPTLPRLLAKAGYLSFQTGKWWHGDYSRGGFTHGMTKGSRHGDAGLTIGRKGLKPIEDFIGMARREEKPFFVWHAPFMPHNPHTPPEYLFEKYKDIAPTPHIARYWAMCEWFDETCGELLGMLDREKLADDTLVIYVTDNGWVQWPDARRFAPKSKTSPYDLGHRTPIMVRWPGRVKPERSTDLASSIDIVPTVLDAVGLEGLPDAALLAIEAYKTFEPIVAASPNQKVSDMAPQFAGAQRRLELPGNRMEIFGTLLDGEKFDPATLAGKVVLVDFWATWCGPCVAEIPAMREHYAKYHDRGFEIVGVSCDDDKDVVEEFVARENIPWPMLHDEGDGRWPPLASHYGLPGIPVMILIGRDGNVVSIQARGAELTRQLAKIFGDPAKAAVPPSP